MLLPLPLMKNSRVLFPGITIDLRDEEYRAALTGDTRFSRNRGVVHSLVILSLMAGSIYYLLSAVPADKTLEQALRMIRPGWWMVPALLCVPLYLGVIRGIKNVWLEHAYDHLLRSPEDFRTVKGVITGIPWFTIKGVNDTLLRMQWMIAGSHPLRGKTPFLSLYAVSTVEKGRQCHIAIPRDGRGPALFLGFV